MGVQNHTLPPVPSDIATALQQNKFARAAFDKLPNSHKTEYLAWIEGAKKNETRAKRIQKMLAMLQK